MGMMFPTNLSSSWRVNSLFREGRQLLRKYCGSSTSIFQTAPRERITTKRLENLGNCAWGRLLLIMYFFLRQPFTLLTHKAQVVTQSFRNYASITQAAKSKAMFTARQRNHPAQIHCLDCRAGRYTLNALAFFVKFSHRTCTAVIISDDAPLM